ncbi:MAG: DUF5659 domain-containing protein [Bacillota bacterium]|nr:DUF5659 domain-containing protein [Bacillota bacterium]
MAEKTFIFSAKIARNLVQNGFNVIDITENMKYKGKSVFVFENTEAIREHLKDRFGIEIK